MQNIYEFSPNTVGILGDLSFSNFKTLRIANLLKENEMVKTLNLSQNGKSDNAMKIIFEMLKINKSLIAVNLIGNDMSLQSWNELYNIQTYKRKGSHGYAKIVRFDAGFPNLQQNSLNLDGNGICNGLANWIGEGLKTNKTLEVLALDNNNITDVQSIG